MIQQAESSGLLLQEMRNGPDGVRRWNAMPLEQRREGGPYRGTNLQGALLAGADLGSLDFQEACFDGANLTRAWLLESNLERASFHLANLERAWCVGASFPQANFRGASLLRTNLRACDCREANFAGANLEGATLDDADLRGADFSTARLKDASLRRSRFDKKTRFPELFAPREPLQWAGDGPPVSVEMLTGRRFELSAPAEADAFDVFLKRLADYVDPKRLARAIDMLKAERFHLYSRIDADALVGVVKSQTEEGVVYSCRLTADGRFACCNQELKLCMGLRGALCKHLLVLIVGLTRGKQIDPGVVGELVRVSRKRGPTLDEDAMAEPLLRYSAAQAGEVDWRPTETIPEDYYAL